MWLAIPLVSYFSLTFLTNGDGGGEGIINKDDDNDDDDKL